MFNVNRLLRSRQRPETAEQPANETARPSEPPRPMEGVLGPLLTNPQRRTSANTSASATRTPGSPRLARPPRSSARSPIQQPAMAGAPTSPPSLEDDVSSWLSESLPHAERIRTGYNMHDHTGDTSRQALQDVANSILRVAAAGETRLELHYGLPATTLPDGICELQTLRELSLANTGLTSLPDNLGQLRGLRRLTVAATLGLKKLPASITRLPVLEILQLTTTPLAELPEDLGRMQSLRELILGGGSYERLPASVTDLASLTRLAVSSSRHLKGLPENIGKMRQLRLLKLESNDSLEQLPHGLTRLGRLKELSLSYNPRLAQLPEDIGRLSRLEVLSLKNCAALRTLPDSVGDLSRLQKLDLRGTGLHELPPSLARLPADCQIEVPEHLSGQLALIRMPHAAPAAPQRLAGRGLPPGGGGSTSLAGPSWNRGTEFVRALSGIDADLGGRFEKWMHGLTQNAGLFRQPLSPADMTLLDQVVAEAITSTEFRSSFSEFLAEHTVKTLNMDGTTQVGGLGPAVRGDVRTAFSEMLKHKLMHTQDQGVALSQLLEAIRNRDLGLTRGSLLHGRNALTGKEEIWPPLRAYVSMHDVEGKTAQEAATTWAMAQFDEAQEGVIGEAEAKKESEWAEVQANRSIEQRARALLREWSIN